MKPVVDIRGLEKTFIQTGPWPWSPQRAVRAVRTLDLSVPAGEILAVVGQSGSGKTTLSRIILGLEQPTAGEIHLEGRRWDDVDERERQRRRPAYQYVPQDAMSALDPQQTALDHVVETLRVLGGQDGPGARRAGREMLERLGLGARQDALPRQMSGGEQRRVTLARVLALAPRLVVADEPTSGLDPDRRQEVLRDLVGHLPEGAACILVTHDMTETRDWCTRAVVMLDGWMIEVFDPRHDPPVHPYSSLLFDPWKGELPVSGIAPSGCPFHLDCPQAVPVCRSRMPDLLPFDPPQPGPAASSPTGGGTHRHRVACHVLAECRAGAGTQGISPNPDPSGGEE